MNKEEFADKIAKYVQKYAPQFNIKVVSPIVGQAILESSFGCSYKAQFNNFFGLKYRPNRVTCNNGTFVDGGSEQVNGQYVPITDQWYSFIDMEMGVLGYFQFINTTNYASVKGISDPYQYLVNLKACGYATSEKYVQNVWNVVQTYGLTKYDDFETNFTSVPKYTIAIDAGHGSETAGKRTPDNYREHWINVCCASYCEQAIKRCGIKTVRVAWDDNNAKDDGDISLSARQNIIKANKCTGSVSFHANAYGSGWNDAQGVETLISDRSSAHKDSLTLANKVQNYLIQGTPQKNRGVKKQALAMCRCDIMGTMGSILVEVGFMTNKAEADLMKTDAFCREQAEEVAHGICDWLNTKYVKPTESTITQIVNDVQTVASTTAYLVKITASTLNVRSGAGTSFPVVTTVKKGQVYTIVEEKNGWGKLKSGVGWISLKYTQKI